MLDNFSEVTGKAQRSHVGFIIVKNKEKIVYFLKDFPATRLK